METYSSLIIIAVCMFACKLQVLEVGGMCFQDDDLLCYFRDRLLITAARLQSWTIDTTMNVMEKDSNQQNVDSSTCNNFGNALLECIAGMPNEQVGVSVDAMCSINFS